MKIGIFSEPFGATLEDIKTEAAIAQQGGASTVWLAQIWRYDALTLIPTLSQIAPDVEFATGVVASYLRHPMTLASQALTVNLLTNGKLTLGANASVAAGPVGRHTAVATDIAFKAEVYSYSRSRGLFAGVALEGAGVTMDRKANARFYGSTSMTPEKIFVSSPNIAPNIANTFVQVLTAQTARLPRAPGMQAAGPDAVPAEEGESNVRTFGLPDPNESETEYDPNY